MIRLFAVLVVAVVVGCATQPASIDERVDRPADPWALSGTDPRLPVDFNRFGAVDKTLASSTFVEQLAWPEPQTAFTGYGGSVRAALWGVYAEGGTELYCRTRFSADDAAAHAIGDLSLSWEHAYPALSAARALGFDDRDCRADGSAQEPARPVCRSAVADLHNLWPAFGRINSSRSDHPYGVLPGEGTTNREFRRFCPDYERGRIGSVVHVEPADDARGDVARSIIYMHMVYGLPLGAVIDDPHRLAVWIKQDPVDAEERHRERAIRRIQRTWNPMVLPIEPS